MLLIRYYFLDIIRCLRVKLLFYLCKTPALLLRRAFFIYNIVDEINVYCISRLDHLIYHKETFLYSNKNLGNTIKCLSLKGNEDFQYSCLSMVNSLEQLF